MSGIRRAKATKKKPDPKPVVRFLEVESRKLFRIPDGGGNLGDLMKKLATPFKVSGKMMTAKFVDNGKPCFVDEDCWVVPD